jgi:hypothetical protein
MIKQTGILAVILLILPLCLQAQRKDLETRYSLDIRKSLDRGPDLALELEQRFRYNSSLYDRTQLTLAAAYDLNRHLEVAAGVRGLVVQTRETGLQPRYRIQTDATGSGALGPLDLSLRVRFQYGFDDLSQFGAYGVNAVVNRYRFKTTYPIFGTRFTLDASAESWGLLTRNQGRFFRRMRYTAGAIYRLDFTSSILLRYMLEDEFNRANPAQTHIVSLAYRKSF